MPIEDIMSDDGKRMTCTYYSLDEFADAAARRNRDYWARYMDDGWAGASFTEALSLARKGWDEHLDATLSLAESAVELCERNHEIMQPEMTYDVAGDFVDIGRYLSGEPECMIDYPLMPTSTSGRVIALCASIVYSASVDPDEIIRRGQVITAFALALSRLGHSVEMWADVNAAGNGPRGAITHRVLVKGPDDTLDPSRILFAYAHPAMLRRLEFAVGEGHPGRFSRYNCAMYGAPQPPIHDLPEGTIYLPEVKTSHNIPDLHEELRKLLRQVGLLREEG